MKGTVRVIRRFVGASLMISILLLLVNIVVLGIFVFKGMDSGEPPVKVIKQVAAGLQYNANSNSYQLSPAAGQLLTDNGAWAMLLNEQGQVVWNEALPAALNRSYTLVEVAQFSRHYLQHYPVFIWEHQAGLFVMGYPPDSLAKYPLIFTVSWLQDLPFRSIALLIGNLMLALLLSLWIGARLSKSVTPLAAGIHALAEERQVNVEPKGVLSDLASSINHTSHLLQHKNNSLKARDEARSNWIAGISHDIRTPLSIMMGYASELEETVSLAPEQQRKAAIIRTQGEKLRSLVQDLNLVSMLEYEMQPLQRKPLRLSALARQSASDFLNNGLEEPFTLTLDIQDEQLFVHADEKLLLRAIANLINNSMAHNEQGCHIMLQVTPALDDDECRLIVADNGKGIAAEELPDLLELPYASTRKRKLAHGHGLGLPMVARIAKAHQGRLILTSDAGSGFSAEMILPRAREIPNIRINSDDDVARVSQ
ncbi:sensor histidine kinase [Paenibacillus sp. GCM10027626]|uniref:sensor histidine kinase n=1 Tax=Paenibacillus sp. GCM10027626 TaxID=3273411 RepID=UPI00362D045F